MRTVLSGRCSRICLKGNGPPNCSHSLPRSRSLKRSGVRSPAVRLPPGGNAGSVWWSASKPTRRRARFCWPGPPAPASNRFCGWLADGEELGALETMLGLGLSRMNILRPAGINLVLRLVHRSLLGIGLRGLSADGAKRYRRLCRDVHPLIVCSGSNTPSLARLFFRARGLAVKFGDRRDMALFDLLIGSINVCNTPEHGNPRFHAIMARGYAALEALKEPDLFEQATPYLGIYHFIEGNYEQAMNLFSRASRKLRAQEHHLVEMFYVRHWSFAASCRGNFELAAGLLLSRAAHVRRAQRQPARPLHTWAARGVVLAHGAI